MEINPKLNLDAFEASFHAIDTHTVGEFTRIITSGFPKLEGDTMIERKNFLAKHYDKYRQALMFEPRGHHDMFGALLTDPFGYSNHRNRTCSCRRTLYRSCSGCSCRNYPYQSRSQKWKGT